MAARVTKPTAKTKIPVKALGDIAVSKKRAIKRVISDTEKQALTKPKTTIVKLKKSPEPKNAHIVITNNTQKTKAPIEVAKVTKTHLKNLLKKFQP